jgi:penicillin-insensitive murein endopeptidase
MRKLSAWRKAHRHVDGSLPSMKSAMKHCKGRSSRRTKCRKNQGRKPSPKRKTSKRKSPKRKTSAKRKSPRRKTSKRKSPKRKSKKRSSKKKSTKKRSYTRKPKKLAGIASAQRDELSPFRRYGPRLQQAAVLRKQKPEFMASILGGPAKKYQPQQQLSPLFGQALPQGMQKFEQQMPPLVPQQKKEQGGLMGLFF